MLTPRPYQSAALDALDAHVQTRPGNPCVVIPTGGGKSLVMALAIQRWKMAAPHFRCMVLAHRKELVSQNCHEMKELWPEATTGIYSAGLRRRDTEQDIIFASIDSVWNRAAEFSLDCIIVDEAHRIPARGEGKYRTFINHFADATVVGMTATPFRMGMGSICHRDHILNEICYEARVADLIRDGYLCKLRSKIGASQPDLAGVKRRSGGDYIIDSLSEAVSNETVVHAAVTNAVEILAQENRKSVLWFCVDRPHCVAVQNKLKQLGIYAPMVTAKTPAKERDLIAEQFKAGTLPHVLNINVYTEGFNAKRIDAIVGLRPTLSKGLYYQMGGRGLRTHPSKTDCLILDYAQCIATHGPITHLGQEDTVVVECGNCGDAFSRAVKICPNCGWEYVAPPQSRTGGGSSGSRNIHGTEVSDLDILGGVQTVKPERVTAIRHKKQGKPDSIRITYHAGLLSVSEWLCLDHQGYAGQKARHWWRERFPSPPPTVDEALNFPFLSQQILAVTESIEVARDGKYPTIISATLRQQQKGEG